MSNGIVDIYKSSNRIYDIYKASDMGDKRDLEAFNWLPNQILAQSEADKAKLIKRNLQRYLTT